LDGLIATGEKIEKIIRDEPNNSTVINIKRVSPTGAMHNMKRGTGVWCAIVVLMPYLPVLSKKEEMRDG